MEQDTKVDPGRDQQMRAARFYGPGDVRIELIERPTAEPGQLVIRNELCGICGTDLHEYLEGPIFAPTADRPNPLTGETAPVVLGHEFVGVVEALGEGVTGFRLGERVVIEPRQSCGECRSCLEGHRNRCPLAATIGLQGGGGGLAEFIAVDESLVLSLNGLSADIGAVVEPLAVALHAVQHVPGGVRGKHALITGGGPIGALIAWVLRALGAAEIVLAEPALGRREGALQFGATRVIDPTSARVEDQLAEWEIVPDVAFECAGLSVTLQACFDSVKPGGTVVNVAISRTTLEINLLPLMLKEITFLGTICYADDHTEAIELLRQHAFPTEAFLSSRIALERLVEDGLEELAHASAAHMKIVVDLTRGPSTPTISKE